MVVFNLFFLLLIAGSPIGLQGAPILGLIIAIFNWIAWIICWESQIKASEFGIMVPNGFLVHEVPWHRIEQIEVNDGLEIKVRGPAGERISVQSIQFGESTIGAFSGYPTHVRAAQQLRDMWSVGRNKTIPWRVAEYRGRTVIPWRPFLVALIGAESVVMGISVVV